ncbi:hypothetical protein B0H12DRAFT_183709 [Mycena haematopus]|nr:hypothetical protein B0H12DRAFT_183709 [Mycena haematopus]
MTTRGPRFFADPSSNATAALPAYPPGSSNATSNANVANHLNMRKAEQKPTMAPTRNFRTRATSNDVCRLFLRNQCLLGDRCHRTHILPPQSHPPLESQTTLSKVGSSEESPAPVNQRP